MLDRTLPAQGTRDGGTRGAGSNHDPMRAFWMPFTDNAAFRQSPMLFSGAEGLYYIREDGSRVLDGMAGLWCVNAGHNQRPIAEAIKAQADQLDFVSSFKMSHPIAFELADRLAALAPGALDHVFFVNSGSEAVDTALKIARAYHRARGEAGRTRFVGRAKAYHGMGWGGLSVGGLGRQRRDFGPLLPEVSHLRGTQQLPETAFSKGQPAWGGHLADELLQMIATYDAATIAAVIVEPVTGSGGVFPPPVGYLERLREICDAHGILLIFDEVITGFGRVGTGFAAERFGVIPDLIACAKGMTNGCVPMGAVIASASVHEVIASAAAGGIELMHGYTYSAHPLACAAGLATLDVYRDQDIFAQARAIEPVIAHAAHALRGLPGVIDIRTIGVLAAIELRPAAGAPGRRGAAVAAYCAEHDALIRASGDTLVLSPPLTISPDLVQTLFELIGAGIGQSGEGTAVL